MTEYITSAEYGRRVGCDGQVIRAAMRDGRVPFEIRNEKKVIDWDTQKDAWKNNSNPEKSHNRLGAPAGTSKSIPPYADSRAIREAYNASIAKLDYEQKLGKMVEIEKINSINFSLARRVRDAVLQIAPLLAPELAAMTDTFEIEKKLVKAINEALTNASK